MRHPAELMSVRTPRVVVNWNLKSASNLKISMSELKSANMFEFEFELLPLSNPLKSNFNFTFNTKVVQKSCISS